ncbi:PREDICTED: protein NRT1/ PTR FAMILY 5.10-like isoform X1 [Ipomoea nil]|uniref:protein NRT1/ PTR FAMILY 5.10-like isoform X1 n=1 Tax=Ipomoea nil TaxID=35883 RepID=UPI000900DE19|nr:PREDICTED: protein NRT1/ PTR FAMILY 5.10-like isoform X1 [Ipomoea nil]
MGQSKSSNCPRTLILWTMASHVKWLNIAAEYALFLLMAYLTDAWGLGFAYAAGIINIWTGLSKLLCLCGAFIADKIGNYWMLLYSTIVYSIGMAFLYMSTPPVLENMAGNCGEDRPECYGPAQKATFYISLVLTGVGMAGHAVSLDPFLDEQGVNEDKEKGFWTRRSLANNLMRAVISGVSSWLLPQHWSGRFGIVAMYGFAATIALAIAKWFVVFNETPPAKSDDKINFCEMFNQTAMVWPSFIMCGVVSSIGNTLFVEQADRMKPTAGVYTVPLGVLLLLAKAAKFILKQCYGFIYKLMKNFFEWCDTITTKYFNGVNAGTKKMAALFGIGMAMLNAVLCCLAAAVVENVRRKDTMKMYLHHDSKFWLVPQFVFVIGIDAFLEVSVNDFFQNYESSEGKPASKDQSLERYSIQFTNFVMGLGFIGSVVSVLAVAKISQSVSGKSWIQKEVSDCELEKYYWVLAVLSSINIVYYVIAAICYTIKLKKAPKKNTAAGDASPGCCSC